jgi:transcriptional regulator with XRE-family HTH domain
LTAQKSHPQWFLAPYCIGAKLRSLRTEKRLTLARLATETGLSTALLSKLETDRMLPTLTTLATICRVYGVGLGHFFCDPAEHLLAVTRNVVTQGRGRSAEEGTRVPLNPSPSSRKLDAAMVHLTPGSHAPEIDASANRAMLVYVLDGQLHLDVGGLRETLAAGDCAYLESDLPTSWGAGGTADCRLLTVMANSQDPIDAAAYAGEWQQPS